MLASKKDIKSVPTGSDGMPGIRKGTGRTHSSSSCPTNAMHVAELYQNSTGVMEGVHGMLALRDESNCNAGHCTTC